MSVLKASRTAQYPLYAEFTFNFDDTMLNAAGASDGFSSVAAHVFDVIPLPPNAVVVGGAVVTNTAFTGSTAANVKIGDSTTDNRYLGTTDITAAGRVPLVPTGYVGAGENLRLTITPTVAAATAGNVTVRIEYVIKGRAHEVQIT